MDEVWEIIVKLRAEQDEAWDAVATKADFLERAEALEQEAASFRERAARRL
jgi:hypothetical protein